MAKNCTKCGRPVSDDSDFCQYCGHRFPQYPDTYEPRIEKSDKSQTDRVILAVVLVVVAIIIVGVTAWGLSRVVNSDFSPTPGYYTLTGTLKVHVENDAWFTTYYYNIYVDGVLKVNNYEIGALSDQTWSFTHTWQSTSTTGSDYVVAKIAWGGSSGTVYQEKGTYVPVNGISNVYFTVG
jgi:hypothetical protein